jgi:fructose-1,6-bisphosphatase I
MKTLVEFIQEQQAHIPNATGEFSRLMNDIGIAAKYVNREVNKAGLADILGYEGSQNIQGEEQAKPVSLWEILVDYVSCRLPFGFIQNVLT